MSSISTEEVLVVPTERFCAMGYFQGFSREIDRFLPDLFDPAFATFQPRGAMEDDPGFKQLIPYLILRHRDQTGELRVFRYVRGSGQGEARLHAKCSIGIGGHISREDAADNLNDPYRAGMQRELEEELIVEATYRNQCVGLINDDQTDVGRVHLGVVHFLDLESPQVRPREDDIQDGCFLTISEIQAERDRLESWSRICLDALFSN